MKLLVTSLTILGIAGFASAAAAQSLRADGDPPRQEIVRYGDLNLATPAGMGVLTSRIDAAASRVCGPQPLTMELRQNRAYRACRVAASETAVAVASRSVQDRKMLAQVK